MFRAGTCTPRAGRALHARGASVGLAGLIAGLIVVTSGSFAALTLAAPPAGAVTVTDEATFRTAFTDANETSIVLGADITLTCGGGGAVFRGSASALTVDGAGHTITQSCADTDSLHQVSTGALTFTDVTFTGGDSAVFSTNGGAVSLTRVTVTGLASTSGGIIAVFTGGPLTVDQSTFRDFTAPDLVNIIAGQQGPVTVTASTISGLHATAGAALAVTSIAGPLSFTDSSVRDLTATDVAIAVSSNSGSVTLLRSQLAGIQGVPSTGVTTLGAIDVDTSSIATVSSTAAAIAVDGTAASSVALTDSEVADVRSGSGAAAAVTGSFSGPVTVTRSLLHDVSSTGSGDVAGVRLLQDAGTVVNSTITGVAGSAVLSTGGAPATIVYSDIVGNGRASSPAGPVTPAAQVAVAQGTLTLFATVVVSPVGAFVDCTAPGGVTSVGDGFADDTSCALTGPGDRQGTGLDPQLLPLADNGGPTATFAIADTSPLFDAIPVAACESGPAAGVTTDQRGEPRPAFVGCDIGAYELQPLPPAPPANVTPRFTG